jgi:hypothetical protein
MGRTRKGGEGKHWDSLGRRGCVGRHLRKSQWWRVGDDDVVVGGVGRRYNYRHLGSAILY